MGDPSDDGLIAGMAAGDRDAAAALVRRYQRRVYGLAVGILGDRDLAEDVAQEAFVRAWRHAEAFDPGRGSAAGWLLTIARNVAIDAIRAERARPTVPVETFLLELSTDEPPEDVAVRADEMTHVQAALADLPAIHRRAVVLATFGGRTAREVGEIDRIPLGTAKTRIRDGLARLRESLRVEIDTEGTT